MNDGVMVGNLLYLMFNCSIVVLMPFYLFSFSVMVNELNTVNSCGGDVTVEDIEDLSLAGVENSTNRQRSNAFVLRRSAKRTAQDNERPQADSFIPGNASNLLEFMSSCAALLCIIIQYK